MPRFTHKQVDDNVFISDGEVTLIFAAAWGDVFFQELLFDLNIDESAQYEHELTLLEKGVSVG